MRFSVGDILGFSGTGFVSDAINIATYGVPRWGLSHVGIVALYQGTPYLYESTTFNGGIPCIVQGEVISGVQVHSLDSACHREGRIWRYQPTEVLSHFQKRTLEKTLTSQIGTSYDYLGAARTGGLLMRLLEKSVREEDLSTLFCSEYVAYALTEARLAFILNASGQSPNSLMRRLIRKRFYTLGGQVK